MSESNLGILLNIDNPQKINTFVQTEFGQERYQHGSFSDFYFLLFEKTKRPNLYSYLVPLSETFTLQRDCKMDERFHKSVNKLVTRNFLGETAAVKNARIFIAYLFMVYVELVAVVTTPEARKNIFQFLTDFPLSKTRVVMVFHTPSGVDQTSGYALDGVYAEATRKVIEHSNLEVHCVKKFMQSGITPASNASVQQYNGVDLSGWKHQGVLLFNVYLTYKNEIWKHFSRCLLTMISKTTASNPHHLSFILAGNHAQELFPYIEKKNWKSMFVCGRIQQRSHFVQLLYHPTHGSEHQNSNSLWKFQLPFINTNYYLYQKNETDRLVDWETISGNAPGLELVVALKRFFDFIQSNTNTRRPNAAPFIIRRQIDNQSDILLQVRTVKERTGNTYWKLSHVPKLPVVGPNGLQLEVINYVPRN